MESSMLKKKINIQQRKIIRKWRLAGTHLLPEPDNSSYLCYNCGSTICSSNEVLWTHSTLTTGICEISEIVLSLPYCCNSCLCADEL